MNDTTLVCPKCKTEIPLDEALKARAEQVAATRIESDRVKLQREIEAQFTKKMELAVKKASQNAQLVASQAHALEMTDLQNRLQENQKQLELAHDQELRLRKKARELEEAEKNWELTKERELENEIGKIKQAEKQLLQELLRQKEEDYQKKEKEQTAQIDIMKKKIDDLRRQAQQGSQQVQGESQEKNLKELLAESFPMDEISDVPTGFLGADLVQRVGARVGRTQGVIVWESKNTKSFSDSWLDKLKKDQGVVKADVAILLSQVLPEDIQHFGQRKGIWLVSPKYSMALVTVLRLQLLELNRVRVSLEGKDLKMNSLYQYLTGSAFQNKMEQLVLGFMNLKRDLDSERTVMANRFNKREKQIEQMLLNTAGFYGDMQGIIGGALPNIPQLELESDQVKQLATDGLFEE